MGIGYEQAGHTQKQNHKWPIKIFKTYKKDALPAI